MNTYTNCRHGHANQPYANLTRVPPPKSFHVYLIKGLKKANSTARQIQLGKIFSDVVVTMNCKFLGGQGKDKHLDNVSCQAAAVPGVRN